MRRTSTILLFLSPLCALLALLILMIAGGANPVAEGFLWVVLVAGIPGFFLNPLAPLPVTHACLVCKDRGYRTNTRLMILEPCQACQPVAELAPAPRVGPRSRLSSFAAERR
jgi:hypothetical protein